MTTITLRALAGEPLLDEAIARNVVAAARALAERTGVALACVTASADRVELDVEAPQRVAIGFAAELRRITERWRRQRYDGEPLWGEPRAADGFLDCPEW